MPSRCAGIVVAERGARAAAAALSLRTGCPLLREPAATARGDALYLHVSADAVAIGPLASGSFRCAPRWRARPPAAGRDPLLRAVGGGGRSVLDACAGFGEDAFALARAGCRVTACEREPVVFELLDQARRRALAEPALAGAAERVALHRGDARELLASAPAFDTVYLDPMFPPKRRRSALPRLEMQVLRALTGEAADDDPEILALWQLALRHGSGRVVWKRPPRAAVHGRPVAQHRGKLVRYDVYAPAAPEGGERSPPERRS